MWHELGILSGVSRTYLVVLVAGMCELSTSVMVYFSPVASIDTCSDVMNSSVCFSSHLSKYTILFVRFKCLELSPLQNFPRWLLIDLIRTSAVASLYCCGKFLKAASMAYLYYRMLNFSASIIVASLTISSSSLFSSSVFMLVGVLLRNVVLMWIGNAW